MQKLRKAAGRTFDFAPRGLLPLLVAFGALASSGVALAAPPDAVNDAFAVSEDSSANSFNVLANDTDPDAGDTKTITAVGATSNGGSVSIVGALPNNTLSYTPAANFAGTETFTYTMRDTLGATDTATVTVTVSNVDDQPTFTSSPVTSVNEGVAYNYAVTTNDLDGDTRTLAAPTRPAWLTFTPGANGTATLSGTPTQAEVGPHNVVLTVSDGTGPAVQQSFTVTVNNVDSQPTFTSSPVTSVNEGVAYNYAVTTNDLDGDTLTLAAPTRPAWLTFTPGANGTATLSGTPTQAEVGPHNVVLTVSDGTGPAVQQSFTVTVNNVDSQPTFTSSPVTSVNESVAYNYAVTTNDPDGDTLTLAAPTRPAWLTFTPGANGTATLTGTPAQTEVGPHNVVLTVSDGTGPAVQQSFTVTVNNVDSQPTFTSSPVTSVNEGVAYNYAVTTNDLDGDTLTLAAPTRPAWLTFTPGANGTATLSGTPTQTEVGPHNVVLTVSDGTGPAVQQSFTVTVNNVDSQPTFTSSPVTSVNEGVAYNYAVTTNDLDGDTLTLAAPTRPAWLTFTPGANGTATLTGTPTQTEVGPHNVVLTVSDGTGPAVQQSFTVTVNNVDDQPTFTSTPVTSVNEGAAYNYVITTNDLDGDTRTLAAPTKPTWLTFTPGANGTATLTGTPTQTEVGPHNVVLTVSDGTGPAVQQSFTVTVNNVDGQPTFTSSPVTSVNEGVAYNYAVTTNDLDGDTLTLAAPTRPAWLTFTPGANGTATLSGTPTQAEVGPHNVVLTVSDGTGPAVQQSFTVTVNNVDSQPTFTSTPVTSVNQNSLYSYSITTNDPDGDTLTFAAPTKPAWLTFTPGANGTATLTGTPTQTEVGPHNVVLTVSDGTGPAVQQSFTVTVNNVDDQPTFTSTPVTSVNEGVVYNYAITTNDGDSDPLTLTASTKPAWLTFTPGANGTATLTGTPTQTEVGPHNVVLTVSDGTGPAVQQSFTVTVNNVNDPPDAVNDAFPVIEDSAANSFNVLVNDTDPDTNDTKTITAIGATSNGGTVSIVGATANNTLSYAPRANFFGTETFTYTIRDTAGLTDTATVTVTVSNVNDPPTFTSAPVTAATEDTTYTYAITTTDVDGTTPALAAPTKPTWLTFTPGANGTATLSGTPNQSQIGPHSVVLTASDGIAPAVQQTFQVTVAAVDDAPTIARIPDQTATEAVPFTLDLKTFVTDEDTVPTAFVFAATSPLPAGLTLAANGVFSGTPLPAGIGEFPSITFTVRDSPTAVPVPGTLKLNVLRAGRADLAGLISVSPNPVALNAPATWTFTIRNNAPTVDVGNVSLEAVFGGEVPVQVDPPATPGCTVTTAGSETRLTCTLSALAGGGSTSVVVTSRGGFAGDVFTRAKVSIPNPVPIDETPSNDTATASLSVAQRISTAPAQRIVGMTGIAAAAGDVNGDGFADLAHSNRGTVVLLNVVDPANANKRTLSETPLTLDSVPSTGIALADLDADKDLDIVAASGTGNPKQIYLNAGSATFVATAIGVPTEDGHAVAVGDVNGDLLPDVVFANTGPSTVYTQGTGTSFTRTAMLGNANSRGLALVDLFGDTLPELVLANGDDGDNATVDNVAIYRNTGGTFALELALPTGPTTSVAAADLNADGRMDLVFGRDTVIAPAVPSDLVWLNTSASTGSFFQSGQLGASPTAAVATADLDLDGDTDILVVNSTGAHQVYTNSGSGTFNLHPQQLAEPGAAVTALTLFGVDQRIDAALIGQSATTIYYNDGAGNLGQGDTTPPTIQLRGEATVTVIVGDAYSDSGATATDTADGDLTSKIVVDNPVNAAVIGTYTVTYRVNDLSGNAATPVTRTVRVQAREGTGGGGGGATGLEVALWLAFLIIAARLQREARWKRGMGP